MVQKKKVSLATWSLLALAAGAVLGLTFGPTMSSLAFIGTIWINMIKMIVVPLIFTIMVLTVAKQTNVSSLGRIAIRILAYYAVTTVCAALIGISVGLIMKPGAALTQINGTEIQGSNGATFSISGFFLSMFSDNMFKTFASGDLLPTLIMGLALGTAILVMKDQEKKQIAIDWFDSMLGIMYIYVGFIIKLSPIGVLFLIADSFANYGIAILSSMVGLVSGAYIACLLQILIVYCPVVWIMARINPIQFIRNSSEVMMFTLATCSSTATIPISLRVAKEKFHIPDRVANFCIPLGSQVNYDGSSLEFALILIAACQLHGIPYTFGSLIQMVLLASLISSSGGGLPGGGIVKMVIMLEALGMPIEIVGIVAGIWRLFDMAGTSLNCLGDLAGTIAVGRSEVRRAKRLGIELDESGFDKF